MDVVAEPEVIESIQERGRRAVRLAA